MAPRKLSEVVKSFATQSENLEQASKLHQEKREGLAKQGSNTEEDSAEEDSARRTLMRRTLMRRREHVWVRKSLRKMSMDWFVDQAVIADFMSTQPSTLDEQHIQAYIQNLRKGLDNAIATTAGPVRDGTVKAGKGLWTMNKAFVTAVMKGQHSDRVPHHIQEYIENLCMECDRASLSFTDVEYLLAAAHPEDEEESACLNEVKEMVSNARAGKVAPSEWT